MAATAHDYTWFTRDFKPVYCITLIRGLSPAEFLTRIGAETGAQVRDAEGLTQLCSAAYDDAGRHRLPIGATSVTGDDGPWTLGVEWNGFAGVSHELMKPASAGTRIVSHVRSASADDYFHWYEDGEVVLEFEPLFAYSRSGSQAEAVAGQMRESGFDLSDGDDCNYELQTAASFALAERLTGVRLTPAAIREAKFLCGWTSVAIKHS